jgi:hypothetical protein
MTEACDQVSQNLEAMQR